jgi:hypothetical protein
MLADGSQPNHYLLFYAEVLNINLIKVGPNYAPEQKIIIVSMCLSVSPQENVLV